MSNVKNHMTMSLPAYLLVALVASLLGLGSCTKTVDVNIPESAQQLVVEGTIENNVPPIIILTKSQRFFSTVNLNDLSNYFVHNAQIRVTGSDGTQTDLIELCLQDLALPDTQKQVILNALGFTTVDSAHAVAICAYTVPDIASYFLSGSCSFMGKERTTYNLSIVAPPLYNGGDSVKAYSSTTIPTALGMDSLAIRPDPIAKYADSMNAVYAYVTVPDTFGNFLRYKTKRNNEPFYAPLGGSVYDDKLFVGVSIGLPIERGQAPGADFDLNTDTYFWKGDTVTVKWSNIDSKTYNFFYTLENDGGGSPFSSPIRIQGNITNGLGVWAGYATKYYTIVVPR